MKSGEAPWVHWRESRIAASNPVLPTEIYKPLQVIGFEGAFWFEVFLFEIDFLVYVCAFVNWSFQ